MNPKAYTYLRLFSSVLILLFVVPVERALAQDVVAKVYYGFTHIDDTDQPENPYYEDVVVYLSPEATIQKSVVELQLRSAVHEFIYGSNRQYDASGALVATLPTVSQDVSLYEYYHNFKERKSYLFSHLFDTYYTIDADFPVINWELMDESKTIGDFECQLAKGDFAGRTYHAWFAPEIGMPYGPWKLHGLPGLILEAHDDKKEVSWVFSRFEVMDADSKDKILSPKDAIHTTQADFEKAYLSVKKNPEAARRAAIAAARSMGRMGLMMDNHILTRYRVGQAKKEGFTEKNINNPIEIGD